MDIKQKIEAANQTAVNRMIDGDPVLVDIAPAIEVIPGMKDRMITHSGPPIPWSKMCAHNAALLLGRSCSRVGQNSRNAAALLKMARSSLSRTITTKPWDHGRNHLRQCLGVCRREQDLGNRAYCRQVEGAQQFGDFSEAALDSLHTWRDVFAPSLRAALKAEGELPLKPIIAQALQMGDELHNRHSASSALFGNAMAVGLAKAKISAQDHIKTLYLLKNHNLIFLGLAMAAGKAIADPARDVEFSTVVTAMCRNGTEFGIRVSGLGDEWFIAPSPFVDGLYVPGYSAQDAGFDMGDSAITETVGWGGFVLGGAPGILSLVGGTSEEALGYTREMRNITTAAHPIYRMPAFNFAGTPLGIDVRKVVQTSSTPIIDTAIAHKEPGYPKIGAGLVRAPMECFVQALKAFSRKYQGT